MTRVFVKNSVEPLGPQTWLEVARFCGKLDPKVAWRMVVSTLRKQRCKAAFPGMHVGEIGYNRLMTGHFKVRVEYVEPKKVARKVID